MNNILEFDSIEKSFDSRSVLSSVYVKSEVGKITGLLGRNGSGKSTLMKIVFGSMDSTFKSIRINKIPLTGNYLRKKRIGYLPQTNWIPPTLTVNETLKHFNIPVHNLVHEFPPFSQWTNFRIRNLSGGYKRILEVYLILNSSHEFILLDEPFSGLMPRHIEEIKRLINRAKAMKGIIINDHMYRQILEISDNTYLLSSGKTYSIENKEDLIFRGYLTESNEK